jgi:ATP-binding cassette subfamily B protein
MASRIVVLEQGRIVEQGTHDGLVASGGKYARMFALQAEGYR